MDIIERLESHNEHCETCDARQLRKDAAAEIRALREQVRQLNALMLRRSSEKMQRRCA